MGRTLSACQTGVKAGRAVARGPRTVRDTNRPGDRLYDFTVMG